MTSRLLGFAPGVAPFHFPHSDHMDRDIAPPPLDSLGVSPTLLDQMNLVVFDDIHHEAFLTNLRSDAKTPQGFGIPSPWATAEKMAKTLPPKPGDTAICILPKDIWPVERPVDLILVLRCESPWIPPGHTADRRDPVWDRGERSCWNILCILTPKPEEGR